MRKAKVEIITDHPQIHAAKKSGSRLEYPLPENM